MKEKISTAISEILSELDVPHEAVTVTYPTHFSLGDYSTNAALVASKILKKNPLLLAEEFAAKLIEKDVYGIEKIQVAAPGFINFFLSKKYLSEVVHDILNKREEYGNNNYHTSKKIVIEYTDPNPFKEFHIGHLMPNVIGESISRLLTASGAEVFRVCYQGDVGLHVALSVFGMKTKQQEMPNGADSVSKKASFLGACYAYGATIYKEAEAAGNEDIKKEIQEINKKIYTREDDEINLLYDQGKRWSLEYFETIYEKLGTTFHSYFFESDTAKIGERIVKENMDTIFQKSEGAIVFKAEKFDPKLHTRVFISKEGIPTYEAKELGLALVKEETYAPDVSIVVTANEINDYFKVLLQAMKLLSPEIASKTKHISHGMLRLPSGKMSSRTGDVITAESLIATVKEIIEEKISDRELSLDEKNNIKNQVSIAAIKYSILKQSIGGNIIFDFEKSLSLEGDSGPYLQYSYTRAHAVLEKAKKEQYQLPHAIPTADWNISETERLLVRFPEVVHTAAVQYEPHILVTYLVGLASTFNSFYAGEKIIDSQDPNSPYKLNITESFEIIMKKGLYLLGISAPDKM